jgi:hypothetical protein
MTEAAMAPDPDERLRALRLMYNVRCTLNPLNGAQFGPNTLALFGKVAR